MVSRCDILTLLPYALLGCILLFGKFTFAQSSLSWRENLDISIVKVSACNLKYEECNTCIGVKVLGKPEVVIPYGNLVSFASDGAKVQYTDRISITFEGEEVEFEVALIDSLGGLARIKLKQSNTRRLSDFLEAGVCEVDTFKNALADCRPFLYNKYVSGTNTNQIQYLSKRHFVEDTLVSLNYGSLSSADFILYSNAEKMEGRLSGTPILGKRANSDSTFFLGLLLGFTQIDSASNLPLIRNMNNSYEGSFLDFSNPRFESVLMKENHFSSSMNLLYKALTEQNVLKQAEKKVFKQNKLKVLSDMYENSERNYATIVNYDVTVGDFESVSSGLKSSRRSEQTIAAYSLLLRRLYLSDPCETLSSQEVLSCETFADLTKETKRTYKTGLYERIGVSLPEIKALERIINLEVEIQRYLCSYESQIQNDSIYDFLIWTKDLKTEIGIYQAYFNDILASGNLRPILRNQIVQEMELMAKPSEVLQRYQKNKEAQCQIIADSLCNMINETPCEFTDILRSFKFLQQDNCCIVCDSILQEITSWDYDFSDCEAEFEFNIQKGIDEILNDQIAETFSPLNNIGGTKYSLNSNSTGNHVQINFEISSNNRFLETYAQLSEYPLSVYRNVYTIRFDSCLVNFLETLQSIDSLRPETVTIEFYGAADGVPYRGPMKYNSAHYGTLDSFLPKKFQFFKDGNKTILGRTPAFLMTNNQKLSFLRSFEHIYNCQLYLDNHLEIIWGQRCETFSQKDKTKRRSEVRVFLTFAFEGPDSNESSSENELKGEMDQNLEPVSLKSQVEGFFSRKECSIFLRELGNIDVDCK